MATAMPSAGDVYAWFTIVSARLGMAAWPLERQHPHKGAKHVSKRNWVHSPEAAAQHTQSSGEGAGVGGTVQACVRGRDWGQLLKCEHLG
jgi:hypothetical protein